jgi:hypothetical protein
VFSLAVVAYELFTGRRPSGLGVEIGPLTGAPVQQHADKLLAVLARAMDADPGGRYPSALAFAAALEGAARGEAGATPIAAAAPAPVPSPEPPAPLVIAAKPQPVTLPRDQPEDDDISSERDDDEAHHQWLTREKERVAVAPPTLFDKDETPEPEAEADQLLIDAAAVAADDSAERYGDEFRAPRSRVATVDTVPDDDVSDSGRDFESDYRTAPAVIPAQGSRMLPLAAMLSLGLLVGFAVGYGVGARGPGSDESPNPVAVSSAPSQPQTAPTTGPTAKDYSEQAVTTPAVSDGAARGTGTPPPVPADSAPAAPPAATRRVAATGRLIVQSNPSRAGVTVNGRWRGRTPLTLDELPFGNYVVRVVQPGFAVSREDVSLSAGAPSRTLSIRLDRQAPSRETARSTAAASQPARGAQAYTGSIYVDSRPQGARVFIDGRSVGVTPVTVPDVRIGSHVVRLELADHRHWSTPTRVASGQEVRVTGSLERIR